MTELRRKKLLFLSVFLAILQAGAAAAAGAAEDGSKTYIVKMNKLAMPAVFESHESWYASTLISTAGATGHSGNAKGEPQQELVHVYDTVFHGFAAKLTPSQASAMEATPGFVHMFPDTAKQLHTTYSPDFLSLDSNSSSSKKKKKQNSRSAPPGLWRDSWYGSDSIVGIFDTGIWPQSKSMSDQRMSPVPVRWKGRCDPGPGFNTSLCNKKLIGARFFYRGYEATSGPINETVEYKSARDSDGHGTHTASTAAGRYVYRASLLGFAQGTARGMAPKARVAAYKVCWSSGCFDSDILAAFDRAVADGVDVISLSVGGGVMPYYLDSIALGSFGAMEKGVFVACSGGNEGPTDLSVTNVAPWITTVGASTMDRGFPANAVLGNGVVVKGVSLYSGKKGLLRNVQLPLVYAADAALTKNGSDTYSASLCMKGSLDSKVVAGKIVLCDRGNNPRVDKGYNVMVAGGKGMILANGPSDGEGLVADSHLLPATAVGARAGALIRKYVAKNPKPTASIEFFGTVFGVKPAPVVASFSSRGPNPETPEILKPDVVAPGVNILAAWTGDAGPTGLAADRRRVKFNIISGTSMACPHVSGLAALLKSAHPTWSPAAIRSALMTSAYLLDNSGRVISDEATGNSSTPFDFGAGHVDPEAALDPGLVYDMGVADYEGFLCSLNYSDRAVSMVARRPFSCARRRSIARPSDLNYPSFSVVFDQSDKKQAVYSATLARTVTNVGPARSSYAASVVAPRGVQISVKPSKLEFEGRNQKHEFTVTVTTRRAASLVPGESETVFGLLVWDSVDGEHAVQSPIAITKQEPY